MKFLIIITFLLSGITKASITHQFNGEISVQNCEADRLILSAQAEKKSLEGAIQKCGAKPSHIRIVNQGVFRRFSPYADPGEICIGTMAFQTIEFSCPNDQFLLTGTSIEESLDDAKDDAIKKAKKICLNSPVKRVSEWIDQSRTRNYFFEFRVSAFFKCL